MTQDELEALPDNTIGFGQIEKIVDGKRIVIPVLEGGKALFHGPDDPLLIYDRQGIAWSVGWADGKQYKQRIGGPEK